MKRTHVSGRLASVLAIIAASLAGAGIANAQDLSTIQKAGDKGDYPVHVGKQVRWASEVYKERLAAARRADEAASKVRPTTLVPVRVGKQTVAVTRGQSLPVVVRQSDTSVAASSEKPERRKARGYFEKRGRATFWIESPQK